MLRLLLIPLIVLITSVSAYSEELRQESKPAIKRVDSYLAVLDIEMAGQIDKEFTKPISDSIRREILKSGQFEVIDRSNMEKILKEQAFQMTGCTNKDCAVEVGQLLGVGKIVVGTLSKMGKMYYLSLSLVNVSSGKTERLEEDSCLCEVEDLIESSKRAARKLMSATSPVMDEKTLKEMLDRKQLEEVAMKQKEEADRRVRDEQLKKQQEEAARLAAEENIRKQKAEEARLIKVEQDRIATEAAERKAREEKAARERIAAEKKREADERAQEERERAARQKAMQAQLKNEFVHINLDYLMFSPANSSVKKNIGTVNGYGVRVEVFQYFFIGADYWKQASPKLAMLTSAEGSAISAGVRYPVNLNDYFDVYAAVGGRFESMKLNNGAATYGNNAGLAQAGLKLRITPGFGVAANAGMTFGGKNTDYLIYGGGLFFAF